MSNGLFYLYSSDPSISNIKVSGQFLLLPCIIEIRVLNGNSVDPDQTPRSVASNLGLNCLPVPFQWDACTNGLTYYKSFMY